MTRAVADILRAAKARIGTPERWCRGPAAWAVVERPSAPTCAAMSIWRGRLSGPTRDEQRAVDALGLAVGGTVSRWNDAPERTHAEVMAAFDRAIAAEEAS